MNLSLLILIPLLTAFLISICRTDKQIRISSLGGAIIQLILSGYLLYSYLSERASGNAAQMLFESRYSWFKTFNIEYYVGVDGISITMIILTAVVSVAAILMSWKVNSNTKEFFFLLSLLSIGAYGFFISLDLFTLFFFLELAVIPKFLLIGIWGSGQKEYSAMKLALMLMGGSALILVGILATYYQTDIGNGEHTFNIIKIAQSQLPARIQYFIFPFLFIGFGIFTALFPFHNWAPDGHSSAPTAASMFLAGISMKLGGYGCLRVATYMMPQGAQYYSWIIILLATIAIVYGAFATLMQKDLKYINAYSSISHCGFVILGIGMLTKIAIIGAVIQMVSHGLMTALLFGAIGMIYERTHTRDLSQLGGLLKITPFIGVVFTIAGLCSLGLPGLSGFVAEMTVFTGSWQRPDTFSRIATILACSSIVVTAVYILRAIGKTLMGPIENKEYNTLTDATWNEKTGSIILLLAILSIGIIPFWLNDLISGDVQEIMKNLARAVSGS